MRKIPLRPRSLDASPDTSGPHKKHKLRTPLPDRLPPHQTRCKMEGRDFHRRISAIPGTTAHYYGNLKFLQSANVNQSRASESPKLRLLLQNTRRPQMGRCGPQISMSDQFCDDADSNLRHRLRTNLQSQRSVHA